MTEPVPNIMKTVTPSPAVTRSPSINKSVSNSMPLTSDGGGHIIKMLLIVFIIVFLGYNLYLYYYEKTDILGKYFGINLFNTGKSSENTVANVDDVGLAQSEEEKADVGLGQVAKVKNDEGKVSNEQPAEGDKLERKTESPIQQAIDKPSLTAEDTVKADISTESKIQAPKKGGYCYIGTDRTYRTCVKMDGTAKCMSGKIFPTKDICINPNLRQ